MTVVEMVARNARMYPEEVPLETIFKGIFPFLAALIVAVAILIAFPQNATFLLSFARY